MNFISCRKKQQTTVCCCWCCCISENGWDLQFFFPLKSRDLSVNFVWLKKADRPEWAKLRRVNRWEETKDQKNNRKTLVGNWIRTTLFWPWDLFSDSVLGKHYVTNAQKKWGRLICCFCSLLVIWQNFTMLVYGLNLSLNLGSVIIFLAFQSVFSRFYRISNLSSLFFFFKK